MTSTPSVPTPDGIPLIGNALGFARDPFRYVKRAVATEGDLIRLNLVGRDVYLTAHPDYHQTVLQDRETFHKPDAYETAFGSALLAAQGEEWRRQRQVMEGLFSPARIQEYFDLMQEVTRQRIAHWEGGETISLNTEMRAIALQNLFAVILGDSVSDAEIDELATAAYHLNLWFKPTSWVLPEWIPTPARYRFQQGRDRLRDHAAETLPDSPSDTEADGLLAALAERADDPDSDFDREGVIDQVMGMLFAGHETTALAMTYGLHQIAAHPEIASRFDETVQSLEPSPTVEGMQSAALFDHLINETLRAYPPIHALPRVTANPASVGEYQLPAEADLLVSIWNTHHDDRFYDHPDAFDPTRWEDMTPRECGYAFIPFGAGPRICIGRHFARLEMKAVWSVIGQRFDLDPLTDIGLAPQMTTQPAHDIEVRLSQSP